MSRVSKYVNILCLVVFGSKVFILRVFFVVVFYFFILHSYKLFLCYVSENFEVSLFVFRVNFIL